MKLKIKSIFLLLSVSVSALYASNQETDSLKKYVTPIASHHTDPKWEHTWGNNKWIRQKFKEDYYGVGLDPEAFYRKAMGGRNPIYVWNDSKKGFLTPKTTDFDIFLKPIIQLHASHTAYDATWGNLDWVKKQYYGNTYKVGFDPEVFYEKVMGGKKPFIHWDTSAANPISLYLAKKVNPYRDFIKKHKNVFFGEICSFRSVFENIGLRQLNRQFKSWLDQDEFRRYMTPVEAHYDLGVDLNRASSFDDKSIIKKMLEGWRLHQVSVLGITEHTPLFVDLFLGRQSLNMKSFLITDPHLSVGNVAFFANNVAYYQHDLVFDFSRLLSCNGDLKHKLLGKFFKNSLGYNPSEQFVAIYKYVLGKILKTTLAGREYLRAVSDSPYIGNNYADARHAYALMLFQGNGGIQDLPEARSYFKIAADQGNRNAQYSYAKMLRDGQGGVKNLIQACSYFKLAAERGLAKAQCAYALMLHKGEGCEKDRAKARYYFRHSANQRHANAQCNYAMMLLSGEGGVRDLAEARRYFKLVADQNHAAYPQYEYAKMLYNGRGGAKDLSEARLYYKLAADQGNYNAQNEYVLMLLQGEGGAPDLVEARRYCKMYSDQGNSAAQYSYAFVMLLNGVGGLRDLSEARKYLKLSADQGILDAQYQYAVMLRDGLGGDEDLVEAKRYFQLSADKGHGLAKIAYDLLLAEDRNSPFKLAEDGSGSK